MRPKTSVIWLLCLAASMPVHAAGDDDVQRQYRDRFGKDVSAVKRTREFDDDLALIERMLDAAPAIEDAVLLDLVCQQIAKVGAKDPVGFQAAADALLLQADRDPTVRDQHEKRIISMYERHARRSRDAAKPAAAKALVNALVRLAQARRDLGDLDQAEDFYNRAKGRAEHDVPAASERILYALERIHAAQQLTAQLTTLTALNEATPNDPQTHQALFDLYFFKLDQPAKAAPYVELGGSPEARQYVPMIAAGLNTMPATDLIMVGDWYQMLSEQPETPDPVAMLRRAVSCYQHFLLAYRAADDVQTNAKLALRQMQIRLLEIGQPRRRELGWIDALAGVEVDRHGWWKRIEGDLISTLKSHQTSIAIPLRPTGGYHLRFWLTRDSVMGPVKILLPVADHEHGVAVEVGGPWCVIHGLGDKEIRGPENSAQFDPGVVHTLDIGVDIDRKSVGIQVDWDDSQVAAWDGDAKTLSHPLLLTKGTLGIVKSPFASLRVRAAEILIVSGELIGLGVD